MNETELDSSSSPAPASSGEGCWPVALLVGTALWIGLCTVVFLVFTWITEQSIAEGSLTGTNVRWIANLVYAAVLLVPLGVEYAALGSSRYRNTIRTWLYASLLLLFALPARLVPFYHHQTVTGLLILGLLLYCFVMRQALRRQAVPARLPRKPVSGRTALALVFAAGVTVPWALFGALGSPLDTLLNLAAGLLLGYAAALTLRAGLLAPQRDDQDGTDQPGLSLAGVTLVISVLIMAAAVGQNGLQLALPLILPPVALAAVLHAQDKDRQYTGLTAAALLLGLAAAAPLIWVDPDELLLVIGISPGEIIDWSSRATLYSFLISLAVVIFALLARHWSALGRVGSPAVLIPTVLAWAGVVIVYLVSGQPGFYGEKLFVILKDQADLSQVAGISNPVERRAAVYQALVEHASASQQGLRGSLERFGIEVKPYYLVNALEVDGGPLVRLWLSTRPEVDRVLDSPYLRPLPEEIPSSSGTISEPDPRMWNLQMIQAPRVWRTFDVRGAGVVIGQADSGVQGDHPELRDSYLGSEGDHDYTWYDPWFGSESPQDFGGHGTHTLGSILGNNVGVAPDAQWIGCVNLARNLGNPAYYLDCWQFLLAPFPQNGDPFTDGDPARGANIINNSWSCPELEGCDAGVYLPAVQALRQAGVFVVVSAGNNGNNGCGSVDSPPAIYDEVYSVGAVDPGGDIAPFSSLGPVTVDGSQRVKPDILAPGAGVLSAFPGSSYEILSGTSMAGPHLAGVVALMWSANPDLIGQVEETEAILNQTARPYLGEPVTCSEGDSLPRNGVGYGVVDAYAAVQAALDAAGESAP